MLITLLRQARHFNFVARTVLVDNSPGVENAIDKAVQQMESRLNKEGILRTMKRNRYYEKPWMKRRRLAHQEVKQVYNREMDRKLNFLLKVKREDPWRV